MAKTKAEMLGSISKESHAALQAEGINPSLLVDWVLAHGCQAVAAFILLLPLLPLSDSAKAAILVVLKILCP